MAIEPIQQYRDPSNSLMQVLRGGTQAITGILDRAIQIGRDMTDKRTRQEQDMMGMRLAETNLAQRRGEELQQNIEDAQRFAQNAYQFEKKFGFDERNTEFTQNRAMTQDVLQQSNADRSYGLAERGLDIREDESQARMDAIEAEKQRLANLAGVPATTTAAPTTATPEQVLTNPKGAVPWRAGADRAFVKGPNGKELLTPQNDTGIPWANPNSAFPADNVPKQAPAVGVPEMLARPATGPVAAAPVQDEAALLDQLSKAKLAMEYNEKLGNKTALDAATRAAAEAQAGLNNIKRDVPPTAYQLEQRERARRDQEMQEKRAVTTENKAAATEAQKEIEQLIKGDTTSFVPQGVVMGKRKEDAEKYGDSTKIPTATEIEEAKAYDSDKVASEIASAKRMGEKEYLLKGPQTPGARAARLKVWKYANPDKVGTSTTPSASSADDYVKRRAAMLD